MLLRHGLLVLAVAAAATGAGVAIRQDESAATPTTPTTPAPFPLPDGATSSALPVSRRTEPSIDRYTRTRRPTTAAARMTSAQKWISSHEFPLVAHDSDPAVSLNVVGWATRPNVSVYVNAVGPNAYNRDGLRDAAPWIVRSGGKRVQVDDWVMIDMRNPAARHWWLYGSDGKATCNPDLGRRAALDLIACGYTGLWIDNILTNPNAYFSPNPGMPPNDWANALVSLLQELRAALPQGVPFTINAHWTDVDFPYVANPTLASDSGLVRAARIADQLVLEGGAIDPGLNYDQPLSVQWSYRRLLAYVDAMHDASVHVQWEKTNAGGLTERGPKSLGGMLPSCSDGSYKRKQPAWGKGSKIWRAHVRTAAFNLASALLAYRAGDSVGDMCEYPGRGFRGYGVDLGATLGERVEQGPAIVRRFTGGAVAVNPGDKAVIFVLPEGKKAINLASTKSPTDHHVASRFRLPARTAVIAKYVGE